MAIVRKNPLLAGLSGRVGDLVFRVRGETTIVSRRPEKRAAQPPSETLGRTLTRFSEAVAFAREARRHPAYRSLSRVLRGYSPYHIAIQDFLSDPVIEEIDDRAMTESGGELLVHVAEKIAIRSVRVKLVRVDESPSIPAAPGPTQRADSDPAAQVSTPALLFFQQARQRPVSTTGEPAARPASSSPPGPEGREQPALPGLDADAEAKVATDVGEQSADARVVRVSERRETREEDGPAILVATWKVTLPRSGEVEITATDYAGNRAVRRVRVGGAAVR